jgi:hypothetical protein
MYDRGTGGKVSTHWPRACGTGGVTLVGPQLQIARRTVPRVSQREGDMLKANQLTVNS